ncbi:MAG TPA: phosphoribosyl-AMP cyclohydrolase [Tepidiformaceae bacterium]|nr:phosphoribosyl-AMP cyclohydrolase [Tepidiformaceae bacterium]
MSEEDVMTFDEQGLIPAVIQDAETGDVLMLGWMSRASIEATYRTGRVTFWSRSRDALWEKGETSGNYLELVTIYKNCEANSFLIRARPHGPTCHTNNTSCYYREFDPAADLPSPQQ